LQKLTRSVAKAHNVDESAVTKALRSAASTEDDQLALARTWERVPPARPVPRINTVIVRYRDEYEAAVKALRDSVCGAVLDILRTREVPTPGNFVRTYLSDVALGAIPQYELQGIADDFADLHAAASAGTLTSTDVRLLLMKYQYC
jgi:hypothetical protein